MLSGGRVQRGDPSSGSAISAGRRQRTRLWLKPLHHPRFLTMADRTGSPCTVTVTLQLP